MKLRTLVKKCNSNRNKPVYILDPETKETYPTGRLFSNVIFTAHSLIIFDIESYDVWGDMPSNPFTFNDLNAIAEAFEMKGLSDTQIELACKFKSDSYRIKSIKETPKEFILIPLASSTL